MIIMRYIIALIDLWKYLILFCMQWIVQIATGEHLTVRKYNIIEDVAIYMH